MREVLSTFLSGSFSVQPCSMPGHSKLFAVVVNYEAFGRSKQVETGAAASDSTRGSEGLTPWPLLTTATFHDTKLRAN